LGSALGIILSFKGREEKSFLLGWMEHSFGILGLREGFERMTNVCGIRAGFISKISICTTIDLHYLSFYSVMREG